MEQTFRSLRATWLQRERQSYTLIFLSVGKWRILRLLFTFMLACSWVFFLVFLSRWVRYHGHTPRSWYVPNVLTHSDSKAWYSSYVATVLFESLWKSGVTFSTVSRQVTPIIMVIIVLLCVRHSFGHLTLLSRLLFHRVSTLSHGKCTFIFGSLNFPTFLQVYFMYHETLGRKLKKYLAKATRSLLGRLVNLPVKKLKFLLYLPPPFSLDKEMSRLTRRNRKIK